MRNSRGNNKKAGGGGGDYTISYISVAHYHRVANVVPNKCLDTTLIHNGMIIKLFNFHIHDN